MIKEDYEAMYALYFKETPLELGYMFATPIMNGQDIGGFFGSRRSLIMMRDIILMNSGVISMAEISAKHFPELGAWL